MGALVWGIGGGLLLYFLTCNFLTLLVKPSWEEPIQTISDLLERDMGLILWPYHDYFIRLMRDSPVDQYNDHWVPYWLHCHLCEVEYDVIAKMETITEDTDFIANKSGLSNFNISLPWANKKRSKEDVTLDYIKQLSLTQVERLYEIYKPDFEMFDYKIDPYLRLFNRYEQP